MAGSVRKMILNLFAMGFWMSVRRIRAVTVRATTAKSRSQPGPSEADVDKFVAEHRDELNASIKRARAEVKKGIHSPRSVKDIAAAGLKKFHGRAARAAR